MFSGTIQQIGRNTTPARLFCVDRWVLSPLFLIAGVTRMNVWWIVSLITLLVSSCATSTVYASSAELVLKKWTVEGTQREALVHLPKTPVNAPIVFYFHGRGGKIQQVSKQHPLYEHWPEAVVVYPQGLATRSLKGSGTQQVPGWQVTPKQDEDRDLKFFDAMLSTFKEEYKVNTNQIYVAGSSNGGGMTFLVWSERGDQLAAVAPTCTAARALAATKTDAAFEKLARIPSLHVVGDKDTTIPPEDQLRTIDLLRKARNCGTGTPWGDPSLKGATQYASDEAPIVVYVYSGGHGLPKHADKVLVQFFKEHKSKKTSP